MTRAAYDSISISSALRNLLLRHAESRRPRESCAILLGRSSGRTATVSEIHRVENADGSPVSFSVSGEDLIRVYGTAEERGLEVVGIFHSHPFTAAHPSATDLKFMLVNPVVWVIAGRSGDTRAFVPEGAGGAREIPITC